MKNLKFVLCSLVMVCCAGVLTAQELIPTPVEVSYKGKKKVKIEQVDVDEKNKLIEGSEKLIQI